MTDERDDKGIEKAANKPVPVPSQQDHKANADAAAAASRLIADAPIGGASTTDECDDTNWRRVRRWFAQPREGSEETASKPTPSHPKRDLMAIADIAAGWLSESVSSQHGASAIIAELFDLATSGLISRLFDKNGTRQEIYDAAFDWDAHGSSSDAAAKGLFLSGSDLMRWCATPSGQAWCRKWGLPDRPKFLYGDQKLKEKDRPNVGRPPKYNWPEFAAEVVRIADTDGLPSKQSELEKIMEDWCETNWGNRPGESTIREQLAPIYQYVKRVGWKSNRK